MITPRMKYLPLLGAFLLATGLGKPPADTQEKVDAFADDNPGGMAVAWVDSDGVTFFTAGEFDSRDKREITPDTQFEIGSVTKVFTALLLAESERKGIVSRHDAVAKYLLPEDDPDQERLAKITLLSLTTHSAGLSKMPSNRGWSFRGGANPFETYDLKSMIEELRDRGPHAPVGRAVAYSNWGVAMLGQALASAWGDSYDDALRTHVLEPLGMRKTTLGISGSRDPDELAPGHYRGRRMGGWKARAMAPAGVLRSSVRDMAIFLEAALGSEDSPLHQAFVETTAPQREAMSIGQVGMGWFIVGTEEDPIAWHNGATAGYRSFVGFSHSRGVGVVVLTNHRISVDKFGFKLLGTKRPRPTGLMVEDAMSFVGNFFFPDGGSAEITEKKSNLYVRFAGERRIILRMLGADRFAILGVPAEISFERDPSGAVAALIFNRDGRDRRAQKTE